MASIEKKLRIQTFDEDFNMMGDRLVAQDVEFRKGPEKTHNGPMKVEVCLFENPDIDLFIEYLNTLRGQLPLEKPKKPRGRVKGKVKEVGSSRTDFIKTMDWSNPIPILREQGFVAVTKEYMDDMGYPLNIPKVYEGKYTILVKVIKKAKNPLNSKYDPLLVVLVKKDKIVFLKDGEKIHSQVLDKPLENTIKVPAKAKMKFPTFLTLDERNQFRIDMEKLRENKDEKPTRLYARWVHEISRLNQGQDFDFPHITNIPDPYAR